MSWEDIRALSPHLRVIAEAAKKEAILRKSWYKWDDELPKGTSLFLGIGSLIIFGWVILLLLLFIF